MTPSGSPAPTETAGTARRWLSIIGVGEDGVEGLSAAARRAVAEAEVVFGGRRHLRLLASLIRGENGHMAKPDPLRHPEDRGAARRAGRGTGVGRPVPSRDRLGLDGSGGGERNGCVRGSVVLQPRGRPHGLGASGYRPGVALRPSGRDAASSPAAVPTPAWCSRRTKRRRNRPRVCPDRTTVSVPAGSPFWRLWAGRRSGFGTAARTLSISSTPRG